MMPRIARLISLALPASIFVLGATGCTHVAPYEREYLALPCMDTDDLRRGRPTAHRQFDEATALLAGDALLTLVFQLIGRHYAAPPALCTALTREIADAAGSEHLIGGQMEDLLAERKTDATAPSDVTRNVPMSPMRRTWVPPQSSRETHGSPGTTPGTVTTRTRSP